MPSNTDDFRVNFSQSYFSVTPALIKDSLTDKEWATLDLSSPVPRIPCTSPSFDSSTQYHARAIIKLGDVFSVKTVGLLWDSAIGKDEHPDVDVKHPTLGMVQTDTSITFLRRVPIRQRNRGYAPRWTNASYFNPQLLGALGGNADSASPSSRSVTWHVYNPIQTPFYDAIQGLENGHRLGYVLSPMLGVCLEQSRKYPLVVYRSEVVGFVQNNGITVYKETADVCIDYIHKITGITAKVK